MIQRWIEEVMYWDVSVETFAFIYLAVLFYAAALWYWVPPRKIGT